MIQVRCDCDQGQACPQGHTASSPRCVIWKNPQTGDERIAELERERGVLLRANNKLLDTAFDADARIAKLERHNSDLQAANNALLERVRKAEGLIKETLDNAQRMADVAYSFAKENLRLVQEADKRICALTSDDIYEMTRKR